MTEILGGRAAETFLAFGTTMTSSTMPDRLDLDRQLDDDVVRFAPPPCRIDRHGLHGPIP
ncbi:hypothetical protein [Methylobacterium sp. XJLW]|uniref:hypothetical protein n=1 Tax=Methylobacterium sp. XJLW TaxID=739141 RepID=UPI000F54C88B|nr:hypothetical protein [Methylobacterium sp. XJLW]